MSGHDDFETEAMPGLPEPLPPGERLLWQGSPDWRALARRAFHVRKVGAYFGLLALWLVVEGLHDGVAVGALAGTLGTLALLASGAVGILLLLAWATAREAIYTVTDKRVVLRFGVALRLTLNVPFCALDAAALKLYPDGIGDIALRVPEKDKLSYLVLWPHARPWRYRSPEVALRCIPHAEAVAELISSHLASQQQEAEPAYLALGAVIS